MAETDTTAGALQGLMQGAQAGSAAGPAAAIIEGTVGLVGGFLSAKSAKKRQREARPETAFKDSNAEINRLLAIFEKKLNEDLSL